MSSSVSGDRPTGTFILDAAMQANDIYYHPQVERRMEIESESVGLTIQPRDLQSPNVDRAWGTPHIAPLTTSLKKYADLL